jgi:predicted permease
MIWWMRAAVRSYPRRWRQRYQLELEALIEQSGSSWRAAFDIARGGVSMRLLEIPVVRHAAAIAAAATGLGRGRHHVRRLAATPAFSLTAVVTLATAIGANALIFSLVNGVILKPLPFEAPERLVAVWHVAPGLMPGPLEQAAFSYFTYRDEAESFEDIGLWSIAAAAVTGRGDPEELRALAVTDGTLPVLRVRTALGRGFSPADDAPGSRETVLLSHEYWQRAFAGSPAAIGQSLMMDGRAREIIGVLPPRFRLLQHSPDLVVPLRLNRAEAQIGAFRYHGVARLEPGVTLERANADLARLIPGMPDRFPIPPGFTRQMYDGFRLGPDVHPLSRDLAGDVSGMLWVLSGAVGMLLLVACANVANLFLVRGEARRQELAVQLALGAGLRRVAGQLLGEALVIAVVSGGIGIGLAYAGLQALRGFAPDQLPRLDEAGIEPVVLLFALALSLACGVLFSVAPIAKYARPELSTALKEHGRGSRDGRQRHRMRNVLVATQVAVALVLLIGSALMLRTFVAIRDVQPGFTDPARVLTARIAVPQGLIAEPAEVARAHEQIRQRIAAVRGVVAVGQTSSITMDGAVRRDSFFVEGLVEADGRMPPARRMKHVAPAYFATMGNAVVAGRDFTWDDVHGHRAVGIVSANLAREIFGSAPAAIGKRVRPSSNGPWREIVGVVGEEHDDGPTRPATPLVYWPFLQQDYAPGRITVERTLAYAVRTDRLTDPGFLHDVQQAVWAVNPNLPLAQVQTLQEIYALSTAQTSFTMIVLAVAGAVTLLLGVVGIYGVIAYVVVQRRREVGIRMALGAGAADVRRLFLTRGLAIVAAGLAAGTAIAAVAAQALETLLFEVSPLDPVAYVAALASLGAVAAIAIWVPTRAATRVAPGVVLRG